MADQKGEAGNAEQTVDQVLDSTLGSVDQAEETVLRVAADMGFDEDDQHRIGISVRECAVNAVVHGNRYNTGKKVHLRVSKHPDRLEVCVGDEGAHFDTAEVPDPLAEENLLRQSGRGLLMIKAFMDECHVVRRQPQGTEVKMVKFLAKAD